MNGDVANNGNEVSSSSSLYLIYGRINDMTKEKNVDFESMELVINEPVLNNEAVPMVSSNFDDVANKIKAVVNKYKDTQLTPDNVNYVKTLKSHFVALRTSITKNQKEWTNIYIKPMKTTVDSMCKDLIALAEEGELALKKQLDDYDQARKDQLTEILNGYRLDAADKYNLREEYADQIVIKDKYYNVTQKEDDSIDDIDAQAAELAKKQNEYDNAVELIKAECEDTTLIADSYIRDLDYKSPMEIILMIKADKKKAKEVYEDMKAKEAAGEKIVIGKEAPSLEEAIATAKSLDTKENADEEIRTRFMKVWYTASQAKLMQSFFADNHIKFEFVRQ